MTFLLLSGRGRSLARDRQHRGAVVVTFERGDCVAFLDQRRYASIEHVASECADVEFDVDADGAKLVHKLRFQKFGQVLDLSASGGAGGECPTDAIADGEAKQCHVEYIKKATELAEHGDAADDGA